MKKLIIALIAALISACLILPKVIASKHQDAITKMIDKLDSTPGYKATLVSTQSAWFGSFNTVDIAFDLGDIDHSARGKTITATLNLDTQYGPLLFSEQGLIGLYETQVRFDGQEQRSYLEWDATQPLYQLSVLTGLSGKTQLNDQIPPFSTLDNALSFSGYAGEGVIGDDTFTYYAGAEQLTITDRGESLVAKGFTFSIDLAASLNDIMQGGFYDGVASTQLDSLTAAGILDLSGLSINMKTALDSETNLGYLELGYLLDDLLFKDFTASDLVFVSQLNNLNNDFFLNYNQAIKKTGTNNASNDVYDNLAVFLQNNVGSLLASQPEFNISSFSGVLAGGNFNANLSSKLANTEAPTLDEMTQPGFWLYNTIASAKVEMDASLAHVAAEQFLASKMRSSANSLRVKRDAERMISQLIEQGLIKQQGEQYSSEFSLEKGQGNLNGNVFPVM
ncbi:DUF945 family protein [Marinomonas algarum]|uniref:YdgA family protein n=1 Tax=Marinomonas algarum TaxID=2883105 RepID=A0A9X1IK31_9GAMM|nr:DUF945 family protein [Marinomonas algarum]MCB5160717.1 YdgA family protein [Marinomonas algarum]